MDNEFCDGVKILLERMDTHPEEFVSDDYMQPPRTRWEAILSDVIDKVNTPKSLTYMPYLTDEEVKAIYEKHLALRRKAFSRCVMKLLVLEEPPKQVRAYLGGSLIGESVGQSFPYIVTTQTSAGRP
jgi:hypothetical protein